MWTSTTTSSTWKPPSARGEQSTPRPASSGTTEWVSDFQTWASTQTCDVGASACSNSSAVFCLRAFMQPLIDCAVCYKTFGGAIETQPKPYVHCVHKPTLTEVSVSTGGLLWTLQLIHPWISCVSLCCSSYCLMCDCQEMKVTRLETCSRMAYSSGASTLLTSIGTKWKHGTCRSLTVSLTGLYWLLIEY